MADYDLAEETILSIFFPNPISFSESSNLSMVTKALTSFEDRYEASIRASLPPREYLRASLSPRSTVVELIGRQRARLMYSSKAFTVSAGLLLSLKTAV